jgi:hypothetical protein
VDSPWVDPVARRDDRPPVTRQTSSTTPWVDTTRATERQYGAPEARHATRARGPLGTIAGQVTQVSDLREERITRPLLVIVLLLALAGAVLALLLLRFVFRAVIALITFNARHLLGGGGGSMGTLLFGPVTGMFSQMIPVLPFRVTSDEGRVVACVLRGSVWGGSVDLGDSIEVSGVWALGGGATLDVRRLRNRTTGAVTRARLPFGVLRGGYGSVLSVLVIAAAAFLVYRACHG